MTDGFGARLAEVVARRGPLCVGIDPHAPLLAAWGLGDDAAGVREFGLRVIDAAASRIGIVKPQISFFERHGSAGYAVLEELLAAARAAGLLVIADVKRGDVGSTVDAYGEAWLTPGTPLEADAMTAVAYQGFGSLDGVLARAAAAGKGVFVLAATSNPESAEVQTLRTASGETIAARMVAHAAEHGGNVGVVVGGTVELAAVGIDPDALRAVPVLGPGFGVQGARLADAPATFGAAIGSLLPSVSRSVLGAGPDGIGSAIDAAVAEVASWQR
ncbi:orotidine-5'-phosphate decarboxylase [Protaetiibacter intestinalis]|uniref:Orotidine-5'-phosphate decarboxylase n=1 Tax=Protaetiibacter intestinalis TaxID=2419774 RepID=A0A387BB02_9MICO|nr:orotidine-5'-phosphate decarboxylase [Protaetiibacter intestinalis]AYF99101.1 orotidine-5'-phosphate decarboxylase [Protaetiibacter intestinalis]